MKMKMINLEGKGDGGKRRRVKPYQIAIGLVALILVPTIGNTFAGTIAVNTSSSGKVEFGQGQASTAACDSNGVTIIPGAKYDSATAVFKLEKITVVGIDFSDSSTACLNKTFKIYVVDTASALANWVDGSTSAGLAKAPSVTGNTTLASSPVAVPGSTTGSVTMAISGTGEDGSTLGQSNGELIFLLTTPYLSASTVNKILIQTQ